MDIETVSYFDGGCGPKGQATYGAIVRNKEGKTLFQESVYVGCGPEMSCNVAEYAGVIAVLRFLLKNHISQGVIYGDSKLVVQQLNGKWKVRRGLYYKWAKEAQNLKQQLPKVVLRWIPRERNREADYLAGQAKPSAVRTKRKLEIAKLAREQWADQLATARRERKTWRI